jgi:DNA-binding HxlR family transcriptional regulator
MSYDIKDQHRPKTQSPSGLSMGINGSASNSATSTCTETHVADLNADIRHAIATFNGKWKLEILWLLSRRMHRFNELRRELHGVTQHTLTQQLRDLERDGMVRRTTYPEVPPRVEYEITDKARGLTPVFTAIFGWVNRSAEDGGAGTQDGSPHRVSTHVEGAYRPRVRRSD